MAFQVSPGVLVQERDLTRIIPAVSTSIGAIAGEFRKGPLDEIVSVSSEGDLVDTFGEPDSDNFEFFFSAANFLQYSNALRVVRAAQTSLVNATTTGCGYRLKMLPIGKIIIQMVQVLSEHLQLELLVHGETIYLFQHVRVLLLMKKKALQQ